MIIIPPVEMRLIIVMGGLLLLHLPRRVRLLIGMADARSTLVVVGWEAFGDVASRESLRSIWLVAGSEAGAEPPSPSP
jgi:hypothetical protein